jgi:hypothetical protein
MFAMAENKTAPTSQSVQAFIEKVDSEQKREDSHTLIALMSEITGEPAMMWGPSIIGFGRYHYKYASGREGDSPLVGFSPRKANLTLYIMGGFENYEALLRKLGKHSVGKACLYVKKLADVDMDVLRELIRQSSAYAAKMYPS